LRTRDLRIETLKVSPEGRTESLRIAFQYPDPDKAYGFVHALVSVLVESVSSPFPLVGSVVPARPREPSPVEGLLHVPAEPARPPQVARAYVEVLDPASVPDVPQLPDRTAIIAAGLIAGLLLGAGAILLGPRNAPSLHHAG
jgi:hypothetical protein